jgi:hypothetical protein
MTTFKLLSTVRKQKFNFKKLASTQTSTFIASKIPILNSFLYFIMLEKCADGHRVCLIHKTVILYNTIQDITVQDKTRLKYN